MKQVDMAEKLKEVLKNEYGINGKDEFEVALRNFEGINLGIFTMPFPEGKVVKKEVQR